MDINTHISDRILKEPNIRQSTPLYKLFPDTEQFYDDLQNALYKSPKNKLVNKTKTPQSKPKVKRNLNDSFSETLKSNNKDSPHLNYSVISENENDASLILKLRLSTTQPYVILNQSDEIIDKLASLPVLQPSGRTIRKSRRISFADEISAHASPRAIEFTRRSSRVVEKKSYVDLVSPEKVPDDFIEPRDNQSPRKRLRSKSVDINLFVDQSNNIKASPKAVRQLSKSNKYNATPESKSSAKKRARPRRSSVTQMSYKEIITDDEKDPSEDSDSLFSSPVKRTRSRRNIKLPFRYVESSDEELIDGVEELAMSDIDDDDDKLISSFSPKKKAKSSPNKKQRESDKLVDHFDKLETGHVEKEKKERSHKFFVDRWRSVTPRKTSRSPNMKSIKIGSPYPSPVKEIPLNSPAKKILNLNSPQHYDVPSSKVKGVKKNESVTPKTPVTHDKKSSIRSNKTPKSTIGYTTPKSQSKRSPQKIAASSLRLMRAGILTPTVQSRVSAVKGVSTPLNKARVALHVGHVPDALPCREKEAEDIYGFIEGKMLDGCGGCMYISGVPGTGKTATVSYVIRQLQEQSKSGELPKFDYINVNGMRLTEPRQSYVEILKQLTDKIVPWEQAQNQLNSMFTKKTRTCKPIVLLIDELDILCTKRQDVVYNLLDWPNKAFCQLIVVTIANTMDLPERLLMGRVTSRLGLTRLTFQAYNHKQLQEIVTKRLFDSKTFNPDAIQLVARKVASVSGDARRALDICRRAAEMAEASDKNALVSLSHVNDALDSMMTQPKIRAIKSSSRLQKLLLQSVVAEIERTGVEETNFAAIFKIFSTVVAIEGFTMVSMTIAMAAIAKLGACRLLLLDQKISGLYQRIMLNVSVDDVYYALKSE